MLQSSMYSYPMQYFSTLRQEEPQFRAIYTVAAILSMMYNLAILIFMVTVIVQHSAVILLLYCIPMAVCIHAIVMHIMGIISTFKPKNEAACMIKFARTSYWINFIVVSVIMLITLIVCLVTGGMSTDSIAFYALIVVFIGFVPIAVAWYVFVFCLYPVDVQPIAYYSVPYRVPKIACLSRP